MARPLKLAHGNFRRGNRVSPARHDIPDIGKILKKEIYYLAQNAGLL